MSERNVEIARAGLDAYNRGDWDGMLEHAAPDFVLDMSRSIGPQQRGKFTLDQVRSFREEIATTFRVAPNRGRRVHRGRSAYRGAHHRARHGARRNRGFFRRPGFEAVPAEIARQRDERRASPALATTGMPVAGGTQ